MSAVLTANWSSKPVESMTLDRHPEQFECLVGLAKRPHVPLAPRALFLQFGDATVTHLAMLRRFAIAARQIGATRIEAAPSVDFKVVWLTHVDDRCLNGVTHFVDLPRPGDQDFWDRRTVMRRGIGNVRYHVSSDSFYVSATVMDAPADLVTNIVHFDDVPALEEALLEQELPSLDSITASAALGMMFAPRRHHS
ncbi:hypothetical protein [Burkholderia sp. MBR-1]|uniref:hypothetical protein n=1 Tax=Burkholderia sp. MBR-1 TaxID=2732364 RepID=UPI0015EF31A3|nr:hypothetical protein [Burkholderia sp. MBR-1]QMI49743.1 hypothetical protein MBR110_30170 [Burkholderia sp. MBR-1]